MKRLCTIIALSAAIATPAEIFATDNDSISETACVSNPIQIGRVSEEIAVILLNNRAPEVQPEKAPTFHISTANRNFILTIGGQVNVITGYDIGNNLYKQKGAGLSFTTSAIPVPPKQGSRSDYFINPLHGYLDFQVVGLQGTPNEISGYIKLSTNGVNSSIILKRAYLTYRNFTLGLKLTAFEDAKAMQPPTIDPEGPAGGVNTAVYEIGYTSRSFGGFRFGAALDMPTYHNSNGYYRGKDYPEYDGKQVLNDNAEEIIPDIPAWIEYASPSGNRIRLSGLLRHFAYHDLLAGKKRGTFGWGAMLSGNLYPSDKVILYYQMAYGKGIGAYIQDIAGKPISFVPDNAHPGHMKASPMMGWTAGVSYNPTPRLQLNAMFSQSRIWDVADYCNALPEEQNYKYALYGAANCFYSITSYLQAGLEYLWGYRRTWDIGGAHDSRIQAQLAFTF